MKKLSRRAAMVSLLTLSFMVMLFGSSPPEMAHASGSFVYRPPWGGVWERGDKVFVGCADGNSISFKDAGIVSVFEVASWFGGANVQKYNQFQIDPREIGGAGIYHIKLTYRRVSANYTIGGPGVGAHGGWVHMFVEYDMVKDKHVKEEVISPHENLLLDAVTMALELWGAHGTSEVAAAANSIWSGISTLMDVEDVISTFGEDVVTTHTLETDITLRNPEVCMAIAVGAEVNGSGVGFNHLTGGLVVAAFEKIEFEKIQDIEPIAEIEILEPANNGVIYKDVVDTVAVKIRIRDEEGETNTMHPYLHLKWSGGSASEDEEVSIDLPVDEWVTDTVCKFVLSDLDPNGEAESGWLYIPAYYLKGDWGYYRCTDRNNFTLTVHKAPNKPEFLEAPADGFQEKRVYFNAVTLDPDEDLIYYKFAWGDGDTTDWLGPAYSGANMGEYHTYSEIGSYPVTVVAKDAGGMQSEWSDTSTIAIANLLGLSVSPKLLPTSMFWGDTCRLYVSAADPTGHSARFHIDWGDSSAPWWTGYYADGVRDTFYHTFDETVGVAHVRVKAADAYGDTSSVVTRDIMIMPIPPVIDTIWADAYGVGLDWTTVQEQKALASCTVMYSADPSPRDSVEVPIPINPYVPACTVSALDPDTKYWFWVEEAYISDDTTLATSFAVFTYTAPSPPLVEFLAPAEDTLSGTVTVQWSASDPDIEDAPVLTIDLDYSRNGGPWTHIGADFDGVNDSSYKWNTGEVLDGEYVIRVIATDPFNYADSAWSDTLTVDNPDNPVVTVLEPGPGDRWSGVHAIEWTATDADGDPLIIHILYSKDHGENWSVLATGQVNDGTHTWDTSLYPDSDEYIVKIIAEDPGPLFGEHVSDIFTVDNTEPWPVGFSTFVAYYDPVNMESVDLAWPAAHDLSPPVRYYIYWGATKATIDYVNPALVTKANNCTMTALPTGSSFFAIGAEDSVDVPNYILSPDVHSVYFTHTGPPSDDALTTIVAQSSGVVTGTAPNFQFDGSVVVIPMDILLINNETCTFTDTTGNACLRNYGLLRAAGSTFQAQFAGDWRGIAFEDQSIDYGGIGGGCMIDSCVIWHAVDGISSMTSSQLIDKSDISFHSHAGVNCYESNSIVTRNEIDFNEYGIYCDRHAPVAPFFIDISSNDIDNNTVSGMHFSGGAQPLITDNSIHDNTIGTSWAMNSFPTSFDHNDIYGNNDYGVINHDAVTIVNAAYNWWGHVSGPSGAAPGWGDAINSIQRVPYTPFLTSRVNAASPDRGRLSGPTVITMSPGLSPSVYGLVYEQGVTEGVGDGGIEAEFGYGPDDSYPWSGGWVWLWAWYNGDQGDYDEFVCQTEIFTSGRFDYCFRFTMDGGETWIYGDHDENDTGEGGTNGYSISEAGDLTVGDSLTIVLVDDDEGSAEGIVFEDALNMLGYNFDLWDVDSQGSPTDVYLQEHDVVIWNTGAATTQTLTSMDETNLGYFLSGGGSLFLSSQGYLTDISIANDFSTNYLHVADWTDNVGTTEVEGVTDDPITDGLLFTLSYPFSNASDNLETDSSAISIFTDVDTMEPSALRYPSEGPSYYRVVFLAFPFEAVPYPAYRGVLMAKILNWLSPPCVPTLFDPPDSSYTENISPEFAWSATAGPGGRYTMEYALDGEFTEGVVTVDDITDSIYAIPSDPLLAETTYYWHVQAIDAVGEESGYQPEPFTFEHDYIPGVPVLLSPDDLTTVNDPTPDLVWRRVPRSYGSYTLEYALDSTFTTGLVTVSGISDTSHTVVDSLADTDYYWHVKAISHNEHESGFQASPFRFTVDTGPPAVPTLIDPGDSAGISDPTPEMVWSSTAGPGGTYTLQYALDSTFTSGLVTVSGVAETTYTVVDSLSDAAYYWHADAVDAGGNHSGYQTHPFKFILDTQTPGIPLLKTPEDSSVISVIDPTFTWSPTAGPGGSYTLQYAYESGFIYGLHTIHGIRDTALVISYPHQPLSDTSYYWHVYAEDYSGNQSGYQAVPHLFYVGAAGVDGPRPATPISFSLSQNFPNPFRSVTRIRYAIPRDCHVRITVYNVLGQRVVTLVDERQKAGINTIRWDAGPLASGIYFCHFRAGSFTQTKKMLVLK